MTLQPPDSPDASRSPRLAQSRPARVQIVIGVVGPGRVGSALLEQVRNAAPILLERRRLDIRIAGIAASRVMRTWDPHAGDVESAPQQATDIEMFAAHLRRQGESPVIVDCTASPSLANHYAEWLRQGIHVVTPNKHAGSGDLERWRSIGGAAVASGSRYLHGATVCAGLPVIQTLKGLLSTGDELISVHGIFSGTLAWIFHQADGRKSFSSLVREAHALGYTEPDPRLDLSGLDVARKLVILAREAGWRISLQDVSVESLVPTALASLSPGAFMSRAEEMDADMAALFAHAVSQGNVLRHVGALSRDGGASVKVTAVPVDHPLANSRLSDNIVQFTTQRYRETPLQIQGPGAGPGVTAGGVFGDILRIAEAVGASMDFQSPERRETQPA